MIFVLPFTLFVLLCYCTAVCIERYTCRKGTSIRIGSAEATLTLSKCNDCVEDDCNFKIGEYSFPLAAFNGSKEDLYDTIASIFHISNGDKQIIEDNSSSALMRCLDVLHRVHHRGDELNMDIVREKIAEYSN